ncbi:MAG TPA: porin, partial [Pseudomonadales bacterium]|nr:porin [Pseudomonadales bacterium]
MKRKLLSIAVAAAAVAPLSTFAAGPTVYGRLDLSTEYETREVDQDLTGGSKDFDSNRWLVRSNSSRIGVKGDSQLFGGLKGLYQAEFGLNADDTSETISGRNTFAGLQGNFGTVLMGRKDTPLKEAQGTVDLFNDTIADIQYYFGGEVRAKNAIEYVSPVFSKAFQFNFMLSEQEEWDKNADGSNKKNAKNGPADSWSTSLT